MVNDNEKKESEKFFQKMWFWIIVIILFWFIGLISFGFWSHEKLGPIHKVFTANPDKIWDSFNILNSLFGAITVVLVYFTYKTQKEELNETQKIFRDQEKEIAEQRKIMDEEKFQNYLTFLFWQKERLRKDIIFWFGGIMLEWDALFIELNKIYNDNENNILMLYWKSFHKDSVRNKLENWIIENQLKLWNYLSLWLSIKELMQSHESLNYWGMSYIALTPAEENFNKIYLEVINKYSSENQK